MSPYEETQRSLAGGWNTWDTRSVLSHVLLPEAFTIRLGVKELSDGYWLDEALIGREESHGEHILPGERSYDGRYTSLELHWRGIELRIESCSWIDAPGDGAGRHPHLDLLITPLRVQGVTAYLSVLAGFLWNVPGSVVRLDGGLAAEVPADGETRVVLRPVGAAHDDKLLLPTLTPYLALPLSGPVAVTTAPAAEEGADELAAISSRVRSAREELRHGPAGATSPRSRPVADAAAADPGAADADPADADAAEVYQALQRVLAWDTIFEPTGRRVISPVSRVWNSIWGGHVLFCWDTYFAAYIAGLENRDLAYANAVEITRALTSRGFVPNFAAATIDSLDRSQPPVGAFIILELYRRYGDIWLLREVYDALATWNRWWPAQRSTDLGGLLAWGSTPYQARSNNELETLGVGRTLGGALESGLDNSPMYDDVPFDPASNTMQLADVGLNSLYILDCESMAAIAEILDRADEAEEFAARAGEFRRRAAELWDDERGIFANRFTASAESGVAASASPASGNFSPRISPTSFYALLGGLATPEQARRMVDEHLLNPEEFGGTWMIPATPRNDPAYHDQDYWRGRIWAPMNFLVYLGLRRYGLSAAAAELADRSKSLLLKEWREHGHIHENYNADTGEGCDTKRSDRYYHWGGLLGVIYLLERGRIPSPQFADAPPPTEGGAPAGRRSAGEDHG